MLYIMKNYLARAAVSSQFLVRSTVNEFDSILEQQQQQHQRRWRLLLLATACN